MAGFARNTVFANIALVLILLAGGIAAMSMIRENFPEHSLDVITITVPCAGADPEEVEEGISQKVEVALEGLEGIKQVTTHSSENVCSTIVEVKEDYDVEDVLGRVRARVNAISTFPVGDQKPVITALMLKEPVMLLYLSGAMSERRIKTWSEKIKTDIKQLCEVSHVQLFGVRGYEIGIEVSEERLREYGLTFNMVKDAIRHSNLNLAGGTIRTREEEIRVRTMGRKYTGEALSSVVVLARPQGEIITLDRVATIKDGFTESPVKALIMVLGIVVDDAIVVGEAIYFHRWQGKPAIKAVLDGVSEVGMLVIAAVFTTIVVLIPLFYVGGIMGKFIAILPLW